jgi:hypothetical protein
MNSETEEMEVWKYIGHEQTSLLHHPHKAEMLKVDEK